MKKTRRRTRGSAPKSVRVRARFMVWEGTSPCTFHIPPKKTSSKAGSFPESVRIWARETYGICSSRGLAHLALIRDKSPLNGLHSNVGRASEAKCCARYSKVPVHLFVTTLPAPCKKLIHIYIYIYMYIHRFTCESVFSKLSMYPFIRVSTCCPAIYLSIYLHIYLPTYLSTNPPLSRCLSG